MNDTDIITIHNQILKQFEYDKNNIENYKNQLEKYNITLNSELSYRIKEKILSKKKELEIYLENIKNNNNYNYYLMETIDLIEEYKNILKQPVSMSFTGKKKKKNSKKKEIIKKFFKIANNYQNQQNYLLKSKSSNKLICNICKSKDFDEIDNNYICINCGNVIETDTQYSSYKDVERVNMVAKYTYDRKIHFRDCINQFQGKQNSTIPQEIYDNLTLQFKLHGLLIGDENTPVKKRFKKISKEHIYLFLKENGDSKYYEDVVLIHYNLTKKKPDDIAHLETKLLDDFDTLTQLYDKIYKKNQKIERKNFINTQYVLFQLLRRHKYPCKRKDFNILKTVDRKSFHDEICKNMFSILGWNFTAIF